ncbi:MAG: hypothetical protein HY700_05365 [Gemmatimonadetes bacterium]|nr:hypothetical protein [Gemmatimonadota bacterium]
MKDRLTGSFSSGGTTYLFEARVQGDALSLVSDGQTYALQRQGANAPAAVVPGPTPVAGGGGGAPAGMSQQDQQLAQLLLSSRWCYFSYSGVAGSSSGSSRTERAIFGANGTLVVQTGGESYYSADVRNSLGNTIAQGSTAGQSAGGQQFRWKVNQGMLMLSGDGVNWQPVALQVAQNSNGYPIITADGKEYSQCN